MATDGIVLVLTRYQVAAEEGSEFLELARRALSVLAQRPGFLGGRVGRATDDPLLWTLTCEWESVGAYRRALGAYDVKLHVIPLMYRAVEEPTAFEVLQSEGGTGAAGTSLGTSRGTTRRAADADEVGVGRASEASVPTDLG